tara:strand:+ start:352 stop:1275 length:924 start_codon:yes stop_codon:yes gene_type:complete
MKKEPLISIGLPVFNGEKYLVKSLNSLINQTYHKIEIIICDDNSNDSSFEICKNYENKNKNILFYQNQKRLGVVPNMIKSLKLAKGDYFIWASQDDIWQDNFISKLLELSTKEESVISMCATQVIDNSGKNIIQYKFPNLCQYNNSIYNVARSILCPVNGELLKMSIFIHGLIKTDYFRKSLSAYPGYFRSERHLLVQLALSGKFSYLNEVLFYKRVYDDNSRRIGDKLFNKLWYSNIRNFFQMITSIIFSPIIKLKFKVLSFFIILNYLQFRFKIFIVPILKKMLSRNIYNYLKSIYNKFINYSNK